MNGKYTCLSCGKTFARKFNMNRHIQTFHKEEDEEKSNDEMENDRADEPSDESSDKEDVQTQGSEADQLDAHLEKNEVFRQWLDTARDASRQARTDRFEKYLAQGMGEADAKEKAHWKTTPELKTEFFNILRDASVGV